MSGPYDRPDDPEEVTLWAGRLRAWPAVPVPPEDEVDDATVPVRRDRDTGSPRVADDDTVFLARRRNDTGSPRVADDDTVFLARRRGDTSADVLSEDDGDDDTVPGRRVARAATPDDTVEAPRARGLHAAAAMPADMAPRRAAAAEAAPAEGAPDVSPRTARVPGLDEPVTYQPRPDAAVRVSRGVPSGRPDRDAAGVRPRSERRARVRLALLGVGIVLLVAAGVTALVLLIG